MIAFIVIGRNEGKKLDICFTSLYKVIERMKLTRYELLYIDSDSTDNSIECVKKFGEVKIFKISGDYNAAIARNIGASESSSEFLFFIDGDMEIMPEFMPLVFDENHQLKFPFVSGQFENNYYDSEGNFISSELYHSNLIDEDIYQYTTGGLFIIKRSIWEMVGGMRNKYRRSQDLDLGLRLAKKGVFLLRKKELLAKHHTIKYFDSNRMWNDLKKGNTLYRSLLDRDHLFNKYALPRLLKSDGTAIVLAFILAIILLFGNTILLVIYPILLLIYLYKTKKKRNWELAIHLAYFSIRDIVTILGVLFFYPSNTKNYSYEKV